MRLLARYLRGREALIRSLEDYESAGSSTVQCDLRHRSDEESALQP